MPTDFFKRILTIQSAGPYSGVDTKIECVARKWCHCGYVCRIRFSEYVWELWICALLTVRGVGEYRWVRRRYQQATDSRPPLPCINMALSPGLKSSPAVFRSAGYKSLSNTAGLLKLLHTLTEGGSGVRFRVLGSLNPSPHYYSRIFLNILELSKKMTLNSIN
jgi:hypothetical protein